MDEQSKALSGRTGIVTGSSRGIGLGIARAILAAGGAVTLTGRDERELARAADQLDCADRVLVVSGSAQNEKHRQQAVEQTLHRFGSVDYLVNNAAANTDVGPIIDLEDGSFRSLFDMNVVAPLAWSRAAWNHWMVEHGGVIVNISSIAGVRGERGIGGYAVTKAALIHLTKQLALELGPRVRVNAVAPGLVATEGARILWEGREHAFRALYPLDRIGQVEDIGAAVTYLVSEQSSWVTGQTLTVDGGFTLTVPSTSLSDERKLASEPSPPPAD